jgi:anaerobic ribonucleoside-triphosphate reductase
VATDVRENKKVETKIEVKVPCEVYSRIVGYLRPIQNWNDGKRQEFKERKTFRVEE